MMSSLTTNVSNASSKTAVFTGNTNIQDITDPTNIIAVDGGATLKVTLTDKGDPGSGDLIGVSFWRSDNKGGGLWFSSNWDGIKTVEQLLAGGNSQIR